MPWRYIFFCLLLIPCSICLSLNTITRLTNCERFLSVKTLKYLWITRQSYIENIDFIALDIANSFFQTIIIVTFINKMKIRFQLNFINAIIAKY